MDEKTHVQEGKYCILFSTADWHTPYWTNKQYTAQLLGQRGWKVLYIESIGLRAPKVGSGTDWKRLWQRLKSGLRTGLLGAPQVDENVWCCSPLVIPFRQNSPVVKNINQRLLRWNIHRFLKRKTSEHVLVWTYHPYMLEAIEDLAVGALVYHCVDDLAQVPGIDADAFNAQEIRLLRQCNTVFVTAPALLEKCKPFNENTYYFSNVVDEKHFGKALEGTELPAEVAAIPEPRIVYHGVLSDFKIDFSLLLELARLRPDWQLVLIGTEREGQSNPLVSRLRNLPNVHFLGYCSPDELPYYLRGMRVGLLPSLINAYTRGMFPMKFYEYLAAGLPVASTPLDFTKESLRFLETGDGPKSFLEAVQKQLARGKLSNTEIKEGVGDQTWQKRMDRMLGIVFTEKSEKIINK